MRSLLTRALGLLILPVLLASPAHGQTLEDDPFAGASLLAAAAGGDVPDEFVEETVFDGLVAPSKLAFSPDGRVFVAQLDGEIYVYDDVDDTTPTLYADLKRNVAFHNDRGLIGMALDPGFTTGRPYLYALYTYDAAIGQTAPRWNDICPDPPGAERDGCVVSGRLSKILPDGSEQPLITDEWCQQYSSHSVGDLRFGPDGALYVSAGDGASYTFADYGQDGSPVNPCGDPPTSAGQMPSPPGAEGGALRSQDPRTTGDPTGLDGTILRIDPDTGAPLPDNPGTGDANARRIIAYGLRNPFRFAFRPGTTEAYIGDVGWLNWEELNVLPDTTSKVRNYGWPCYEGVGRQTAYEALGLKICGDLYAEGVNAVERPLYTYNHASKVATERCSVGSSSISGVAFYDGTTFPVNYRGAMFFADYARNCIWVMFPDADGRPNPATRQVFVDGALNPVDLTIGPGGDLYYVNVAGSVQRVRAINPNQAPTARIQASQTAGPTPLTVQFDASGSTDPNNDTLQYAWDLDGDGAYDDSTAVAPSRTYAQDGNVTVRLRVTDPSALSDTETVDLEVGTPPTTTITSPAPGSTYAVGDRLSFSGSAVDAHGDPVPDEDLVWSVDLHHCSVLVPTSCHVHHIQNYVGVRAGEFVYPDHEYPSYVTMELSATAASGLRGRSSVRIDPKTVELTFDSVPSGLTLAVGGEASTTPFTRRVAQGSTVGVAAPPSTYRDGHTYDFGSWSDGGAAAHQFTAPTTAGTYVATYAEAQCPINPGLVGAWGFDEPSGTVAYDASDHGNTGTVSGATRSASGRFGSALTFDGVNDVVRVPDSASLDLTTGMTVEAWVQPSSLGNAWRTVLFKENAGHIGYALYAADDTNRPSGNVGTPFEFSARGTSALALNTWTHLATTFDGSDLRLYVNGVQVAVTPVAGDIDVSAGALTIGGNSVWSEWFEGRIDDVRLYDRPLNATEIAVDMTRPVTCVSNPDTPALAVSPASLAFTGEQGAAPPAAKTLEIANTGSGTLSWSASADAGWLAVGPASGTGAGVLSVNANPTGLAPGTYTGTVTITAPGAAGAPRTVPVTLTVTAAPTPVLGVTPATLGFSAQEGGTNPASKSLTVANSGGGTLQWTASDDAAWLAVTPADGSGAGTINVTPSVSGLVAGTYTATVTVSAAGASGSPKTIPVTFVVDPPPAPPALSVAPAALTFSAPRSAATVEAKAINVTNSGGGTLSFTAAADAPWLSVTPASDTAPRTVSVKPSTAGLAPGTYTATVTITAAGVAGSPTAVAVTFTVTEAPACVTPAGLVGAWAFDEETGSTALDAAAVPHNGTVSGATRAATGRFGRALSFDGVNDMVTIADAAELRLTTGMTLSAWVNPTVSSAWRTVLIKERSGGLSTALYSSTDTGRPSGHVSTPLESDTRGTAALGTNVWSHLATTYDGATLRLFVNGVQVSSRAVSGPITNDAGALRIGGNAVWSEYFGGLIDEVRVYNRAQSATEIQADMAAPVTCAAPVLSVTPTSLAFGDGTPKTLTVTGSGWTASENVAWLSLSTSGNTVTVTPSLTGLAPGTYTTTIAIGSLTVPVTLTVPAPPVPAVTPEALSFSATQGGTSPAAKTLSVTNTGGGTLSWTASETAPWLSLAPASGTNAGTITVTATLGALPAGTYATDITVAGKTVPVTFTVAPPAPVLSVSPSSLAFRAVRDGANPAAKALTIANAGDGTLDWTASADAAWVDVSPASGTDAGTVDVTVDVAGLAPGTHDATVTVASDGAPRTIPVSLTVDAPLTVTPSTLAFSAVAGGSSPAAKTFDVAGAGWTATESSPWLSLSTSGSTVTVTPTLGSLAAGTYTADVTVATAEQTRTVAVALTVTSAPATPSGLVAAYGFEETGTTTTDSSGSGNLGTISGATRVTTGRFGNALSFDGVNDWVSVPNAASISPTTGITMSAWVNATAAGGMWRTVLMKEQPGNLIYALYANDGTGKPSGHVFTTGDMSAHGTANTALNTWVYLTSTWDGATLRLFVNGTQVASRALTGTLRTSTGVLRIGGTAVWSEWFRGQIDEVRIYNRALSVTEIQGDMGRPVVGG